MDYLISGVPFDDLDLDHFNVIGDNEAFQFYKQFFLYFRLLVSVKGQCHFYMLMKFEVFYRNEIYCIIYVHTERQLLKAR